MSIYFGYGILTVLGTLRDWIDALLGKRTKPPKGYAPITRDFEEFYRRRMYRRIVDCFNRPITGPAGGVMEVFDRDVHNDMKLRVWPHTTTKKKRECGVLGGHGVGGNPKLVSGGVDRTCTALSC